MRIPAPLFPALLLAPLSAQGLSPSPTPLPFAFVENRGQWHESARYRAALGPLAAWVLADGWRLHLHGDERSAVLDMRFVNKRTDTTVEGLDLRGPTHSWLRGTDPGKWVTGARSYGRLRFASLYEGVDVVLRRQDDHLEYDLLLQPGADLDAVRIRCDGGDGVRIESDGMLVVQTPAGPLCQAPPATWAVAADGTRRTVPCRYVVLGADEFGFAVDGWDGSEELVVDPGLVWSTYVGGSDIDRVYAVAVGPNGETVAAGQTLSPDLPVTPGVLQPTYVGRTGSQNGDGDAFVAKLNANGRSFSYVTYLGGNGGDEARGVAFESSGVVTVGGSTWSTDFPTTPDALRRTASRFDEDVFVARLDATGSTLLYGTYFGGRFLSNSGGSDRLSGLTVDESLDWIYLNGWTSSTVARHQFPVTANAYQAETTVQCEFLAILDLASTPGSTVLQYSTFLSGSGHTSAVGPHHVDAGGIVTLAGITSASDHPTTAGAFQTTRQGGFCAYITRIDPGVAGAGGLVYSTYLGGSRAEEEVAAATDSTGGITAAGTTLSLNFPVSAGAYQSTFQGGSRDGYLVRLDPTQVGAAQLRYGSYLGGSSGASDDWVHALAIADGGIALVGGSTNSRAFPTTAGSFQRSREKGGGHTYGFLSLFDTTRAGAQSLVYSTAVEGCGTASDKVLAVHYDHASLLATIGGSAHSDFVISETAPQPFFGGGQSDGFVTRLDLRPVRSTVAFGQSCAGTQGLPELVPDLDPQLCNRYRIEFRNLPPNQALLVYFGWSRTQNGPFPLPFSLSAFGMSTCRLYISLDVGTFTTTGTTGTRGYGFLLPGDPSFLGVRFHNQGFFSDPGANAAGMVATNAVEAQVRW